MRELIRCWQHTRMIVLIALCAALYVAVLLPFKIVSIIPGITEIRPAAALPVFFSFFFGPAAAWGAAFGNTIGDVLGGTIGPGTIFGFFGNLLYGFIPYRIVRSLLGSNDKLRTATGRFVFVFIVILASGMCALPIALGVDLIGIPFGIVVHTIFLNNTLVSFILVPLLIAALGQRIRGMNLGYDQILHSDEISTSRKIGPFLVFGLMLLIYLVRILPFLSSAIPFLNLFQVGFCIILVFAALLFV